VFWRYGLAGLHPSLQGSQEVLTLIATDIARRDAVWVHTYMDILAELNRQAWLPWGEKWDMDPCGTNPRINSYALLRTLIKQDADFFSATLNERIVGFGVGITLQPGFVEAHEWWQPSRTFEVVPQYGDYELHMVFVDQEFRNQGIFKQLANVRLAHALRSGAPRIWLNTIERPTWPPTVRNFYADRDFRIVGSMSIKGSKRLFMVRSVTPRQK
jgi:GNAT superfamily N-acetyltransferase